MSHPCKISVPCDHCYSRDLQKSEKFEKNGRSKFKKIRSSKFEFRISIIRIVHDLTQDLWVIHAKFQSPVITVTAVICKNPKIWKNSKFQVRISNIRIVHDLTQDFWVIHAKFQSPLITVTVVICKNSENSEKFEVRISNIRIVENHLHSLKIIHISPLSCKLWPWCGKTQSFRHRRPSCNYILRFGTRENSFDPQQFREFFASSFLLWQLVYNEKQYCH